MIKTKSAYAIPAYDEPAAQRTAVLDLTGIAKVNDEGRIIITVPITLEVFPGPMFSEEFAERHRMSDQTYDACRDAVEAQLIRAQVIDWIADRAGDVAVAST